MPKAGPVLLLSWNPYRGALRPAVAQHLEAVAASVPAGKLVTVNAVGGASPQLRRLRPSAVLLHTTFLGTRWLQPFEAWRRRSSWLADLDVPKMAFPQDDYDHADVLDEWLAELGVTSIFSPLAEHHELYARARAVADVEPVLTGYIDDGVVARLRPAPPRTRPHDVVYRAASLPYWFGSHGQLKRLVGEAAQSASLARGWSSDISLDDVITGDRWFDHLGSGRVVVGAESGSSVLDHRGEVRRRIQEILAREPKASFDEVAAQMTEGWDSSSFTALSPRHLEAAMTGTAQVLVEGEYSGVLEPGKHYVPVKHDLSDLPEAVAHALDPGCSAELVEASRVDIVESGRYSYRRLSERVRAVLPEDIGRVPALGTLVLGPVSAASALRVLASGRGGPSTD